MPRLILELRATVKALKSTAVQGATIARPEALREIYSSLIALSKNKSSNLLTMFNGADNGNTWLNVKVGIHEELYEEGGSPEKIGRIKGANHGKSGAFTLATDNLSSVNDAVETIRHEALAH